jgi:hypothetical protein
MRRDFILISQAKLREKPEKAPFGGLNFGRTVGLSTDLFIDFGKFVKFGFRYPPLRLKVKPDRKAVQFNQDVLL